MLAISKTPCCALHFLKGLSNFTTLEVLKKQVATWRRQESVYGATSLMCVTIPRETTLEKNLLKMGWTLMGTIPRRNTMGPGPLKIWVITRTRRKAKREGGGEESARG